MEHHFLAPEEVADILHADLADVHLLIQRGELHAIRIGTTGKWRIEVNELEKFIEHEYEESRKHALWHQSPNASMENVYDL